MSDYEYNSWLQALKPFALTKNEDIKEMLKQKGIDVHDFTLGDPKEPTPAFIKEVLIKSIADVSQYPLNIGNSSLRMACANWIKNRFSVNINSQTQVISSNGSKEAVFHIHQVLLNAASQKRIVVFPEPGYPVYKSGCVLAGGVPYENQLKSEKKYVFDPTEIPTEILPYIAAVWLCYPHNPTGATISVAQMEKIYEWALLHNIKILSDECYVDMFYEGSVAPTSFLKISEKNNFKNVVSFFSLSKRSGMTGYRSGFVAGEEETISLFAKYRLNVGLGTPDFIQQAAAAAWSETTHVFERNKIFAAKRKIVDKFFAHNKIEVLPSNATFYVWGYAPKNYPSGRAFTDAVLNSTGIMCTPGDAFGTSCSQNFRLALVPTCPQIESCFEYWQQQIDKGNFKL
ncbi:MAG: aminotransferase class I/II-fold pyridoxal phosphate-dependent enzyme [Bdellovibrionota bacterium]